MCFHTRSLCDSCAKEKLSWPCFTLCTGPLSASVSVLAVTSDSLTSDPCQVPEWTKCSSREKRKEKKVEKPFYSDSEGESGATESADSGKTQLTSPDSVSSDGYKLSYMEPYMLARL